MKNTILRRVIVFISLAAPWPMRKFLYRKIFGYRIDPGAKIGRSIILVDRMHLAKGASIGDLNVIKGLCELSLGVDATIGRGNWITAVPKSESRHFRLFPSRTPSLRIGDHSAVTSRHTIDCTGGVTIGEFSTFGGFRSQILTHSIDISESHQGCAPVVIGKYCFIGTGSIILSGASLPDYSVLGAGSMLNKEHGVPYSLYAGVPARFVRAIDSDAKYFSRPTGFVE